MNIRRRHRVVLLALALGTASAALASPETPGAGSRLAPAEAVSGGAALPSASATLASQAAGLAAAEPGRGCPKVKVVYAGYGEAARAGCATPSVSAAR